MDPTAGIAWEAEGRPFFDRLWSTVRDATIDPVATFKATGIPGPSGPSIQLTLITAAVGHIPLLLCLSCAGVFMLTMAGALMSDPNVPAAIRGIGAGAMCGVVAMVPIFVILGSLYTELCYAVVFHLVSTLAGGKGSFQASTRAMMYTGVIRFWMFLLWIPIPILSIFIHWGGRGLMLLWSGFACYGAAQGVHRLEGDRAIMVGIVTPLVVMVLSLGGQLAAIVGVMAAVMGGFGALGTLLPH